MASAMEDFLAAEKAPMVNQIEHLYEHDLAQVMNNHRAGDTVKVSIFRGKQRQDVAVVLGETRDQV